MTDLIRTMGGVHGLGYVGFVSAVCLASQGCQVIGVDVNADKVDMLGRVLAPIIEVRIDDLTAEVVAARTPTVTTEGRGWIRRQPKQILVEF